MTNEDALKLRPGDVVQFHNGTVSPEGIDGAFATVTEVSSTIDQLGKPWATVKGHVRNPWGEKDWTIHECRPGDIEFVGRAYIMLAKP